VTHVLLARLALLAGAGHEGLSQALADDTQRPSRVVRRARPENGGDEVTAQHVIDHQPLEIWGASAVSCTGTEG
jgi:hypothetical protein